MSDAAIFSALNNIIRNTQRFIDDTSTEVQRRLPTSSAVAPRACLPDPPSLYPRLIAVGANEKIASEMNRVYNTRTLELQSYYESSINDIFTTDARLSFPPQMQKQILDTFTNLYLTTVKSWIEEGVDAYKNRRKPVEQVANNDELSKNTSSRRTFNTDYIPLLERFFDENQFPTQADKVFLAQKSGMTYRQIHVWFQNRRNRVKKSNGSRRKRSLREGANLPLDDYRSRIPRQIICEEQPVCITLQVTTSNHLNECKSRRESPPSETVTHRTNLQANDVSVLDKCTAPLHAFPSRYPPVHFHKPFSLESRTPLFSEYAWQRRPNHDTSSQLSKIDVHDLADRFTLLSVRDIDFQSHTNNELLLDTLAATRSITVIPPPAPHPALIKPREPILSFARWPHFPIVRASQPAQAFTGSTTSSSTLPRSENSSRKTSSLPKRYPRRPHLPCCNVTPSGSDSSSPYSSSRSLSDLFDFEKETSPVSCSGLLTPLWSPQPVTCSTA